MSRHDDRPQLDTARGPVELVRLDGLAAEAAIDLGRLPHTIKVLLENLMRREGSPGVSADDVLALARWPEPSAADVAFMPARILMQDFTGVPAVVDLAAMRSAMARAGGDPGRVNPLVPVDLIIDHSVQVDVFGRSDAFMANVEWEYRRNRSRSRTAWPSRTRWWGPIPTPP